MDSGAFTQVHAFPQKDDPHRRVFRDAKLSTVVFGMLKTADPTQKVKAFRSTRHPGKEFESEAPSLLIATADLPSYDPSNVTIVSCSQTDWDLAVRLMKQGHFRRLGELCTQYQGEVNETTDKRFLSDTVGDGQEVLRGASVCLYAIREASQGVSKFIVQSEFLNGKAKDGKSWHFQETRVGFQRSAPQNNFRRIIAAPIPKGEFCFDTISYIPASASQLSPELLLGLLNSQLLEWYFRLGSSNSKLNEYQFDNLPCPLFTTNVSPETLVLLQELEVLITAKDLDAINRMVRTRLFPSSSTEAVSSALMTRLVKHIIEVEEARGHVTKQNRSRLAIESQAYQSLVNDLLFAAAGFTRDEVSGIESRMKSLA